MEIHTTHPHSQGMESCSHKCSLVKLERSLSTNSPGPARQHKRMKIDKSVGMLRLIGIG